VKILKLLQRGAEKKSTSKAEALKKVRQQTDQLLKQQEVQKGRQQEPAEKKN
jgi:hypothetical protein